MLSENEPATLMLSFPTAPASPAAMLTRSPLRWATTARFPVVVTRVSSTKARVSTCRSLKLKAPAIDFEPGRSAATKAAPPVAVSWKKSSIAVTARLPADTWPASTIEACVVSLTRLTEAAPANAMPVGGGPTGAPRSDWALSGVSVGTLGSGFGLENAPAMLKAQRSPSSLASRSTCPVTAMLGVRRAPAPLLVRTSGSPITAFVVRSRSLIATEIPTPIPSPLAMPPTQVTWVVRSPA